jgi:Pro-kumamolisin, activation domain
MKDSINGRLLLRASIVAALAATPLCAFAADATNVPAGIDTTEAPRVTQTVDMSAMSPLKGTHLGLLSTLRPAGTVDDSTPMNHLQLVLQPSAERVAALQLLISQQHDPNSRNFHQWLTPEQYGQAFGVVDADIVAVTAWLTSQGFTVNGIYPSKFQIDFSGTAGLMKQAFHTQEARFKINGENHIANTTDISVPAALQPVITGVMGLNDIRPKSQHLTPRVGRYNAKTGKFTLAPLATTQSQSHSQSISIPFGAPGGARALVPDDFQHIYGISPLLQNGVVGQGITIALVEDGDMMASDYTNFVTQFSLTQFGGTFSQIQPNVAGVTANCIDPIAAGDNGQQDAPGDNINTLLEVEYATATAPGANIVVASCSDLDSNLNPVQPINDFGGVFVAALNLINGNTRPDIISSGAAIAEGSTDAASKAAIDAMWAQADAEGISVFVASGDGGINPGSGGFNFESDSLLYGAGIDANSLATSPNVTAVGGTDLADIIDGTTAQFFNSTPNAAGGSALGYVPEIPWNASCGNGVVATARGWSSVQAFCVAQLLANSAEGNTQLSSVAGGGGPSSVDSKPAWQRLVTGAEPDQSRDLPDVALFAGSYGDRVNSASSSTEIDDATSVLVCDNAYPCTPSFTGELSLTEGTAVSTSMFAGIQALIDQGLKIRGVPADQGNAAPTLYALAEQEYGSPTLGTSPATLTECNADNGSGTANCIFHNITRGSISTNCEQTPSFETTPTPDCFFYGTTSFGFPGSGITEQVGLTSVNPNLPYSTQTKAFGAQPGWSFASGLGSVNAKNLLIAWRAFVNAPPAQVTGRH